MSVREKCVEAMARAICQSDERNGGAPWDWYKPKAREPYYEAAGDALDAMLTVLADGDSALVAAAVEAVQRIGPHDHIGILRAMLGVVKGEADGR